MKADRLLLLTPLREALELKRLEKLEPGLLATNFPEVDWKGAMGFRDVIAHQYFDLDAEQVLLICQDALPGLLSPKTPKPQNPKTPWRRMFF